MFDIGFFELVVIGVVGLLVLGPERLPHAIRMGSAYLGKIRRTVLSVREEFEREVNIKEMQDRVKKQLDDSGLREVENTLKELKEQIEIEPKPAEPPKKPEPLSSEANPTISQTDEADAISENRIEGGMVTGNPIPTDSPKS